ncbi:MAG: DUF4230 domain-containing protein [Verrucomicrobia bacterium]|nr:DUF4230 domain-containing protein [Kiritimatiellia bacterium]MCP5488971.1 DUF4230 domain-containing protein [Verrucomicrobiota bacterium]
MDFTLLLLLAIIAGLTAWIVVLRGKPARSGPTIFSTIQQLKAIGHLSVFKAVTKEIVTETDHTWGDFGKKYLSWVISNHKLAMIFDFEIDFRYDLRRSDFTIEDKGDSVYAITLPPCIYEVHIRDIRFYDEQASKFMPWLLPDLVNSVFGRGFSEEDKNRLIASAKAHAEKQARGLIDQLQTEVQTSAKSILESMSKAFGAEQVHFTFLQEERPDVSVEIAQQAA